MKNDIRMVKK